MKKSILLFIFPFMLSLLCLEGQTIHRLSLDECVELAAEQNFQMRKSKSAYDIAKYQYLIQLSRLKTNIGFSVDPSFSKWYNPQTDISDSNGNNLHTSNRNFSTSTYLRVHQPLATGGYIDFSPGFILERTDYYATNLDNQSIISQSNKTLSFRPSLNLVQPLSTFYAYNSYKHFQENTELSFEKSELSYRQAKFLNQYQIGNIYIELQHILQGIAVQKKLLSTKKMAYNKASEKNAENSSELLKLKIEIERTETALNDLFHDYAGKANNLKEQLALPARDSIIVTGNTDIKEYILNMDELVDIATERHLQLKKYNIDIKLDEISYKETKSQSLPRADLSVNFNPGAAVSGSADLSYLDLMSDAWDRSKRKTETLNDLTIGLSISLPVYEAKRIKNARIIAEEKIRLDKINVEEQEQLIQSNIYTLVAQIEYTLENLKILEGTKTSTQQNIEDDIQKFYNNKADSYHLAYDFMLWEEARLNYNTAIMNYNLLLNRLEYEILDHMENL
ncbi:TolC family protein [Saccharicrinis sp. FJH54]|uniref:TolC family protein n=1 Tax=Saccharicrinis sp. FJH54 TaxID=3344665 RepID=UPI0035D4A034